MYKRQISFTKILLPEPDPISVVARVIDSPLLYPLPPAFTTHAVISPPEMVTSKVAPVPDPFVVDATFV